MYPHFTDLVRLASVPKVKQHATDKADLQTRGCLYSYTLCVRHDPQGHTEMMSNYHRDTAREVLVSLFL